MVNWQFIWKKFYFKFIDYKLWEYVGVLNSEPILECIVNVNCVFELVRCNQYTFTQGVKP